MSLAVVSHIDIPDTVLKHRFFREAMAIATLMHEEDRREPVIGTANSGECELYGWSPCVAPHRDNKGIVYIVALTDGDSTVYTEECEAQLKRGTVVRLDDRVEHWTIDERPMVAAFVGAFAEPCDEQAMAILREGVRSLSAGDYYDAPRVKDGFRALLDDECLVTNWVYDTVEPMLISDALVCDLYIERCGECGEAAVRLDQHWPYFNYNNRCRLHLSDKP